MTPTVTERRNAPRVDESRSDKIRTWHRERLAMVYIRQSTPQQVLVHQESTRLQYELAGRAEDLGWGSDRIVVVDDDLGKSGASAAGRAGFQRVVTEVSLDHVGIILGVEMSRLARCNKDWHQLLELCALFRTLIADVDGIYDPAQYNDRLLLGLKGTMSEAELHILKQRMRQGALSKARRGELKFALPIGYLWDAAGQMQLDPDEQVQQVVRLIFHTFDELGTINAVVRYLAQHRIELGVRVREGPGKGELVWHRPFRVTVHNILTHPLYAGAYVYGRRQVDPRRKQPERPQTGRVVMDPADWHALLPDHCPAYISWAEYERNQERLQQNRAQAEARGAVRQGAALLAGLVVCARCTRRLQVHYNRQNHHSYHCTQRRNNYGEPLCQCISGPCLDAFVRHHVLAALEPATLELSLAAAERVQQERDELTQLWQQRLERARYEADRAARQYHAVEPENRLVVRTLERAWEERLVALQRLEEDYRRVQGQQPRVLTSEEREQIRQLAVDIPALWDAPMTTMADRKEIVRQIVDHIVVDARGRSEQVAVTMHWIGGGQTDGIVTRPVARYADLSYYPELSRRIRTLAQEGLSTTAIAQQLTAEGYRPPQDGAHFGEATMRELHRRLGITPGKQRLRRREGLAVDEWWPTEIAQMLEIPRSTLYTWMDRGWLQIRRHEQQTRSWIVWADEAELARLRQLRQQVVETARSRQGGRRGGLGLLAHAAPQGAS